MPPGGSGFSLIELAVALAILGILVASALPSYRDWIADAEVANLAEQLASAMSLARAEAIKHGGRVNLCTAPRQLQCEKSGGWENGWLIFADDNRNGEVDPEEAVIRSQPAAHAGLRTRASQPVAHYVSYTSLGNARLLSGALQMGTITVCRPGRRFYQVILANSGRVRIERGAERCTG